MKKCMVGSLAYMDKKTFWVRQSHCSYHHNCMMGLDDKITQCITIFFQIQHQLSAKTVTIIIAHENCCQAKPFFFGICCHLAENRPCAARNKCLCTKPEAAGM